MEETAEKTAMIHKKKQKNIRLYPIYKMLSWDLLFYYSIVFLFMTQTKNISAADFLLAESFYPLFKSLLLVNATILIEKIGKRKSLILANFFLFLSTLTYILSINFIGIIIGEFFSAVGFVIKGICESNMLYDSLDRNKKRGWLFSRIEGQASSWYYYIDAVASILSGFLFAINGYIPMVLCLCINLVSVVLAYKFEEVEDTDSKKEKIKFTKELKNIKNSVKDIFSSNRLRPLIIFGALFSGIISVLTTLRSSILTDIGVPAQYFGIIIAVMQIVSGISAKNQARMHNKFRNKTLATLSLPVVVSCIFLGFWCNLGLNYTLTLIVVLIVFFIHYVSKGPFYTLIKRYMNNFTNTSLRNRISSCFNMLDGLLRAGVSFFASFLLRYTTTANTFIIAGCVFTLIIVLLLDRMKTRVGLKPEEYKEKDIKIMELK